MRQAPSLRSASALSAMTTRDDDFNPRSGRIHHGNQGAKRAKSFVGEVVRAAKKAGHRGQTFKRSGSTKSAATVALSKHVAYLTRDGVTRDGADARMFDAISDDADTKAFAERCEEDRHHFRFTVSPEDEGQMADLRAFTRELMKDAERDLGTGLDWVAVDHWNTDNPHVHVLARGRADDGKDLVISRDYIGKGFRCRAATSYTGIGPAEIAGCAVFLASPAGAFVTGHNLVCDGGTLIAKLLEKASGAMKIAVTGADGNHWPDARKALARSGGIGPGFPLFSQLTLVDNAHSVAATGDPRVRRLGVISPIGKSPRRS